MILVFDGKGVFFSSLFLAQSAEAVEYTDCISAEG